MFKEMIKMFFATCDVHFRDLFDRQVVQGRSTIMRNIRTFTQSFILLVLLAACATNPVTHKKELSLIPESVEIQMGAENYMPARQMQGGDYVVHPEVVEYVREVGRKLAAVSDRKLPYEFAVVNSSEINAWMMPGGKMAINRGLLLKMHSEAELAAVIGHEITHAAAKHAVRQLQEGLLLQGAMIAASLIIDVSTDKDWVKGIGALGVQTAGMLLSAKFSRDDEREADHYGMVYMSRAGYDPRAAITVQEMLLREAGAHDSLFERLLSDHPPSPERVAAAKAFAPQLPPGGEWGKKRYRKRLAALFRDAPAYEAYDKARKALKNGDFRRARALVDRAIRIQPKEAMFHLLKGGIYERTYMETRAVREYKLAARLNPGYYQAHLKLGLLLDSMGRQRQARTALENSVRLLKTAAALHRLGRYALQDGDYVQAKTYLKQAAESDTKEGRAAFAELLRIDLPSNAGAYMDANLSLNDRGKVRITVQNNTPFPVGNIVVEVSTPEGSKRVRLGGSIGPNSESAYDTQASWTQEQVDASSVRVVSARLAGVAGL